MHVEVHDAGMGSWWVPATKGLTGHELIAHSGFFYSEYSRLLLLQLDEVLL